MHTRPSRRRAIVTPFLALFALVTVMGCGDDDPAGPGADAILGSWQVTSFSWGGVDLVNDGMDLDIILNSDGNYRFEVTNDQVGICEDQGDVADCSATGSYAYTATTVTIDDDEPVDAVTFDYAITGNGDFMTWTGTIDGVAAEITLQRL